MPNENPQPLSRSAKPIILFVVLFLAVIIVGGTLWYIIFSDRGPGTGNQNTTAGNQNTNESRPAATPVIEQPDDADRDGLTDEEEAVVGTKPDSTDTDEDGLSDLAEVKTYSSNPLQADSDGDTRKDGEEVMAGSDPNGTGTLLDLQKAIDQLNNQAQ